MGSRCMGTELEVRSTAIPVLEYGKKALFPAPPYIVISTNKLLYT